MIGLKKVIVNTDVITEDGILWNGFVKWEGNKILEVGAISDIGKTDDCEIFDARGKYTAPGLIDIHNHGTGSYNFSEDPLYCCERVIRHGVTTVLPTLYTSLTLEEMLAAADRIRDLKKTGIGRIMRGLYMEGPYMNSDLGSFADLMKWAGPIDARDYVRLVDGLSDLALVWAVDPAREGIGEFLSYLRRKSPSAIVSLGHSSATFEQCRRIEPFGITLQTHHGDSGKAKGKAQGTIGAGCDEYTLYRPDMYAELICDEVGIHLTPGMIRTVIRIKGVERIILISDSFCSKKENKNNEARGIAFGPDLNYDDEGFLAGSRLMLDAACRNVMKHTGYGLCHAIRFSSANPAKMLGIDGDVGSIAPGKTANLILIDDKVNVDTVILEGETAVSHGEITL